MDAKSRALLLGEADRWAGLGLLDPANLPRIAALYPEGDGRDGPSFAQLALFDLAGAVLGAAIIAFVLIVLDLRAEAASTTIAAFGTVAIVAGAVAATRRARPAWADTLLVAGAVAYAVMAFPEGAAGKPLSLLALAGGVALPALGHRRGAVGALGAALFMLAGLATVMKWLSTPAFIFDEPTRLGATVYLLLALAYLAALVLARRRLGPWPGASGVAALAFVLPLGFFLDRVVLPARAPSGTLQLAVALGEGLLLGAAFALKDRAMVVGASIGVAGAAVLFAFAVGGPALGVTVLLLVAAALVLLGFLVRRRMAPAS